VVARASPLTLVRGRRRCGPLTPPSVPIDAPLHFQVPLGETITLQIIASGIPIPTYQWMKNGTEMEGQTSARLVIPQVPYGLCSSLHRHPPARKPTPSPQGTTPACSRASTHPGHPVPLSLPTANPSRLGPWGPTRWCLLLPLLLSHIDHYHHMTSALAPTLQLPPPPPHAHRSLLTPWASTTAWCRTASARCSQTRPTWRWRTPLPCLCGSPKALRWVGPVAPPPPPTPPSSDVLACLPRGRPHLKPPPLPHSP
jgi:hypothetical protein